MSSCPNKNDPTWKKLVEKHGELVAIDAYMTNNYQIPATLESVTPVDAHLWSPEKTSRVEGFREIMELNDKILVALGAKLKAYSKSDSKKYVKDLTKLVKEFSESNTKRGAVMFLQNAEAMMKDLGPKLDKVKDNLTLLKQTQEFASTFDLINDMRDILAKTDSVRVKQRVSKVVEDLKDFNIKYEAYAKDTLVRRMAAVSPMARAKKREELNNQYTKDNPRPKGMKLAEHKKARDKYVGDALNSMNEEILQLDMAKIRQLLTVAPKDITDTTMRYVDAAGVNDPVLQYVVDALNRADFKIKEGFIEDRVVSSNVYKKFIEGKTGAFLTDQKKLYEDLYEVKKGKPTGYYTRQFYSEFYKERTKMWAEYNKQEEEWKASTSEEEQSLIPYKDRPYEKVKDDWKKKHLIDQTKPISDSNIKDVYHNNSYTKLQKDPRKKEMYDYLIKFNEESDAMITNSTKLGYKLPSMTKRDSELLIEQGLLGAAKTKLGDTTKVKIDDVESGELKVVDGVVKTLTDERGRSLKRIAVQFRGDLEMEDQSFDLMGMALSNRFVSRNFKEKNAIKAEMEVIRDLTESRQLLKKEGSKQIVKTVKTAFGITKEEEREINETIKGSDSNSLKLLASVLEDRLYGKHDMGGNEKLTKAVNLALKLSANNMLIGSYLSSTSNALAGLTMNWFESVRGEWYGQKNLLNGEIKYLSEIGGSVKDIDSLEPQGMTNLFINKFLDTSMGFSGMSNDMTQDSRIKRAFSMSTLHGMNSSVEHFIQGTMVYAVMDNIKVKDKLGNYVDKEGNIVADRDSAATMDEIYKVSNGVIKWSNNDLTIEGFDRVNKDTEYAINRRMKDIAADLHGNYDSNNKAMIQRYWYGKLAFYLRKWIVRGVQNRWRGIDTTDRNFLDVDDSKKFISYSTGKYKEGSYTSAVRFIRQNMQAMLNLRREILTTEWDKLTDMEQANIKKSVAEFTLMFTTLAASAFLGKLALEEDDEKSRAAMFLATYLMRRQAGELMVYFPGLGVNDAVRTVTTPTSLTSSILKVTNTTGQLIEDLWGVSTGDGLEIYKGGLHKDESKSKVALLKLLSGYSGLTADSEQRWKSQYNK